MAPVFKNRRRFFFYLTCKFIYSNISFKLLFSASTLSYGLNYNFIYILKIFNRIRNTKSSLFYINKAKAIYFNLKSRITYKRNPFRRSSYKERRYKIDSHFFFATRIIRMRNVINNANRIEIWIRGRSICNESTPLWKINAERPDWLFSSDIFRLHFAQMESRLLHSLVHRRPRVPMKI